MSNSVGCIFILSPLEGLLGFSADVAPHLGLRVRNGNSVSVKRLWTAAESSFAIDQSFLCVALWQGWGELLWAGLRVLEPLILGYVSKNSGVFCRDWL